MLTTRVNEAKAAVQDNMNSSEMENIKQDYRDLKNDVSSLAKHLKQDGAAIASKAVRDIEEQASEKYGMFKDESRKQMDRLEAQVHAKPMQSIAIAFGVGALLALLARR